MILDEGFMYVSDIGQDITLNEGLSVIFLKDSIE